MAAVVFFAGASLGANATENASGIWTIFTATNAFQADDGPSRWHYWLDAQARYTDLSSGANQYLIRPGVGYSLDTGLSVWAGYARFRTRNRSGAVVNENRYWQQLSWTAGHWHNGTITMRARLLQRSVSAGDDLGLVLRLQTKYVRPIGDNDTSVLILSLEPFFDLQDTDWGGKSRLRQNRAFIGVGWRLSDNLSIETGYLNQYLWRDNAEDRIVHLGTVNFKVRL